MAWSMWARARRSAPRCWWYRPRARCARLSIHGRPASLATEEDLAKKAKEDGKTHETANDKEATNDDPTATNTDDDMNGDDDNVFKTEEEKRMEKEAREVFDKPAILKDGKKKTLGTLRVWETQHTKRPTTKAKWEVFDGRFRELVWIALEAGRLSEDGATFIRELSSTCIHNA